MQRESDSGKNTKFFVCGSEKDISLLTHFYCGYALEKQFKEDLQVMCFRYIINC